MVTATDVMNQHRLSYPVISGEPGSASGSSSSSASGEIPHVMVNGTAYRLSAVRSNLAGKSYRLASTALAPELANMQLPPVLDRRMELPPVRDQGTQMICGGITGATTLEWKQFQNTHAISPLLSAECLYEARANKTTGGMSGYDIVSLLEHHGTCTDATWRAWKATPTEALRLAVLAECQKYRVCHDVLVDSIDMLKVALKQNGACLFFAPCYNGSATFWKPQPQVSPNQPPQMMLGGHAVTAVGFDDNRRVIILRNSWTEQYGDHGYAYFPYEDWDLYHWDSWTAIGDTFSCVNPNVSTGTTTTTAVAVTAAAATVGSTNELQHPSSSQSPVCCGACSIQ